MKMWLKSVDFYTSFTQHRGHVFQRYGISLVINRFIIGNKVHVYSNIGARKDNEYWVL